MNKTIGVGGYTKEQALAELNNMTADVKPISLEEYQGRIEKAQQLMQQAQLEAVYLNAGTNLYYFTGTRWYASERSRCAPGTVSRPTSDCIGGDGGVCHHGL